MIRRKRKGHKEREREGNTLDFYYLFSNGAVGEGIRASEKCQRYYSIYNGGQDSSVETHLFLMFLFLHCAAPKWCLPVIS